MSVFPVLIAFGLFSQVLSLNVTMLDLMERGSDCFKSNLRTSGKVLKEVTFKSEPACIDLCLQTKGCKAAVTSPRSWAVSGCYAIADYTLTGKNSGGWKTAERKCFDEGNKDYTLKVMCDDYTTIYLDGKAKTGVSGTGYWNSLATTKIPASTKSVMIKCYNQNTRYPNGIKAQILDANGNIVSDTGRSWQCSTSSRSGFKPATVTNQHSNWKSKLSSGAVIWTSSSRHSTAYCKFDLSVDGGFGAFGSWSTCSAKCGGGTESRFRKCDDPAPARGGRPCLGAATESRKCNTQACPVNGRYGAFGSWSTCTAKCAGGTQSRSRKCDSPAPAHGGKPCTGTATESRKCNTQACPDYTLKVMCDDYTTIFLDNKEKKGVAGTGYWNSLATTKIPASTKTVTIRCHNQNTRYPNGIKAQILNADGKVINDTSKGWQCSSSPSSRFKAATHTHQHSNWKSKLSSGAVIWTDSKWNAVAYCKTTLH